MACDYHHAHASYVHGKLQFQLVRTLVERPWSHIQNHRIESVVLAGAYHCVLVTADCRHAGKLAVAGAYDAVKEVPGLDAKGLGLVHLGPRVRSLEGGEVQKALVHNCKGIGHGFT